MEERKRIYERPSMEVILLQHETALLTGSGDLDGIPDIPDFTPGGDPFES